MLGKEAFMPKAKGVPRPKLTGKVVRGMALAAGIVSLEHIRLDGIREAEGKGSIPFSGKEMDLLEHWMQWAADFCAWKETHDGGTSRRNPGNGDAPHADTPA